MKGIRPLLSACCARGDPLDRRAEKAVEVADKDVPPVTGEDQQDCLQA